MGRLGIRLTTSLTLRTIIPNNKQKSRIAITDITNKDIRKLLRAFNNSPYKGYKKKHVHDEPTKSYLLLNKKVYKVIKIKKYVWISTKGVKLDIDGTKRINEKIGHVKTIIQSGFTSMNGN